MTASSIPRDATQRAQPAGLIAARLTAAPAVLKRGDPGYDQARTVWNAMADRRPRIIARCASAGEVITAVRAARDWAWRSGCVAAGTASWAWPCPRTG